MPLRKRPLPPAAQAVLDRLRDDPPTADEVRAATHAGEADRPAEPDVEETRVVFAMTEWRDLEFLADALPEKVAEGFGLSAGCEDEEEEPDYTSYCWGMSTEQMLEGRREEPGRSPHPVAQVRPG